MFKAIAAVAAAVVMAAAGPSGCQQGGTSEPAAPAVSIPAQAAPPKVETGVVDITFVVETLDYRSNLPMPGVVIAMTITPFQPDVSHVDPVTGLPVDALAYKVEPKPSPMTHTAHMGPGVDLLSMSASATLEVGETIVCHAYRDGKEIHTSQTRLTSVPFGKEGRVMCSVIGDRA